MKKKYEIPEAEELSISLEMGLLQTTGSDQPIVIDPDEVMPEDEF